MLSKNTIEYIVEALKVVLAFLKDPEVGLLKKQEYERHISLHEVFLESVPTCLVLTFLGLSAAFGKKSYSIYQHICLF